jgi:hypothetical protein
VTERSWHPRTIGESVLDEVGRFAPVGPIGAIVAAWPQAVGETIAAEAWPARLARDGTLHVTASSSVWAYELAQLEETILGRLREALDADAPARLRFAAGRVPSRESTDARESARRRPPPPSEAARRAAAAVTASIEDEELRALVAEAAARSLSRPADRSL